MPLAPGTRVGVYEIQAAIGAGGMGEVCRARDVRLQRDVALKILPEAFASDPERVARFEREAQMLAALNHPRIAAIHGVEQSVGVHAPLDYHPVWASEGDSIVYLPGANRPLFSVPITTKPRVFFGTPVQLPRAPMPDPGENVSNPANELRVVLNWSEELKRLVPAE
jgi:hypothetical protein